jgi:hypothetical protein
MNGSVTVRQAEDLEGGALTYSEIKAIASGDRGVMEKVKVDTEIRKLDQFRASHISSIISAGPDHHRQGRAGPPGHANAATTLEHYIKSVPESVRVAVESLYHLLKSKPGAVEGGQAN